MVDEIDTTSSSQLKCQIATMLEADNRTAVFDALSSTTTNKADFFDCVIFAAR